MQNTVNTSVPSATIAVSTSIAEAINNAMPKAVVQNDTASNPSGTDAAKLTGSVIKFPKSASAVIGDLIAEKDSWFNNAYKTSNDQLYVLLGKCYGFYRQLQEPTEVAAKLRKELAEYVKVKCPGMSSSSHTLSKIVKCVFGADRRRVSAYSIVLRTALAKNIDVAGIPDFIRESGGVEEVRLAKSPNAMTAKQKATAGASTLANKTIVNVTAPVFKESLDAGNIGKPVVLLGTWNADGSITVHAFTNSEGAVNAALVAQFSLAKAVAEAQKVEVPAANDSQIAKTAVTQAVAEATALPLAA
jgi:hypothetical protein